MTASAAVTRARRRRIAPHVPVRCGVVIGHSTFSATLVRIGMSGVRTTEVMSQELEAPTGDSGWAGLAAALMELAQRIGAAAEIHVALLPPIARTKRIELPPVARSQIEPLLAHSVRRYFALGADPVVTGVAQWTRASKGITASALAACASEAVITDLLASAEQCSLRICSITTAAAALVHGVHTYVPALHRGGVLTIACHRGWREAVHTYQGRIVSCQPLENASIGKLAAQCQLAPNSMASARGGGAAQYLLLSGDEIPDDAASALKHKEPDAYQRVLPLSASVLQSMSPFTMAAVGSVVGAPMLPSLLPAERRASARRAVWRQAARIAVAACLLTLCTGGVHLWGVRREVDAVQARRGQIALQVSTAVAQRRAADEARARLAVIHTLLDEQPLWARLLPAVSTALSDSAYLTSLSVGADRVQISGVANAGATVLADLARVPLLSGVTASIPLQRDQTTGKDRFNVSITLDAPRQAPDSLARLFAIRSGPPDTAQDARLRRAP